MSKRLALSLAMLLASGCSRAEYVKDGVATDEGIAAIALPKEQYREMLKRTFLGTTTGPMTLGVLGLEKGCDVHDEAVEAAVAQNLAQWRANLIAAYRNNVPPDQLAEAVQKSPRRARAMLQPHLSSIGDRMKRSSQSLLQQSGVQVMQAASAEAQKVDLASIDMQARQRELDETKASGEICGVRRWQQQ